MGSSRARNSTRARKGRSIRRPQSHPLIAASRASPSRPRPTPGTLLERADFIIRAAPCLTVQLQRIAPHLDLLLCVAVNLAEAYEHEHKKKGQP